MLIKKTNKRVIKVIKDKKIER